jgi:hypothetical protein
MINIEELIAACLAKEANWQVGCPEFGRPADLSFFTCVADPQDTGLYKGPKH